LAMEQVFLVEDALAAAAPEPLRPAVEAVAARVSRPAKAAATARRRVRPAPEAAG